MQDRNHIVRMAMVAVAWLGLSASYSLGQTGHVSPRLVLQITVDQLRGDMPGHVIDRCPPGGFRRFYEQGMVFENAHHRHANTETIVGHTTLATGADPSVHGMVGNIWLNRETGRLAYNIEDARYPLLTAGAGVNRKTELDPTQAAAGTEGRSPGAILVSTLSDELALSSDGEAKIFGVSVKDRGAVSMAGHAGKAFWFSKAAGEFVTSSYYYDRYPDWVSEWNRKRLPRQYAGTSWGLLNDPSSYRFAGKDDMPWETEFPGFGRVFPHPYGGGGGKMFTTFLTLSPAGDALTLDFAKTLLKAEQLGADSIPDYLAISFSSTDYVGHIFGPSSLESEDNLLRLDRTLAELLDFVDEQVGLEHTLIVLSADHGAAEVPGYLNSVGIPAEYFEPLEVETRDVLKDLKQRFAIGRELVEGYHHPYLYLNREEMDNQGLDYAEIERAVAAELMKLTGVTLAISSTDLREGRFPDTWLNRAILRNFHPKRSGDIYLVLDPHWFINDFDGLTVASSHGSPWRYDTFVPLVFMGPGIEARRVARAVETVDIAPTLASLLGVKCPSGTCGEPLVEALPGQP